MTEEEAKQKWCPMFNGWVSASETGGTHYKCKGSDCMMWRWRENYHQFGPIEQHKPYGYCGLGGKP
jgi:hypothetical protein